MTANIFRRIQASEGSVPTARPPLFPENYRAHLKSTIGINASATPRPVPGSVSPNPPAPADPLSDFLARIAAELAAADADLLARRYAAALSGYDKVIGDIGDWRAGGNPDSSQLSEDEKLAFNGILDGEQGMGNYVPLESVYFGIFGRATDLPPEDQAFYGLKIVTVYLDWGNSQFRNDDAALALTTYLNISL